ncbi:NYN domain-containing protein [Photorhabdus namnaonensis]|uniref:NYN domain protein n=1 Tax=Photorhabdus namnaonensis TaxID=1851568 RepID=A0A1B8YJ24_9GAMM|nr:NYN domain-containing protein [Photorhabdus namnaonensis]OCA55130.1 NYN domain protein [Photorhabdus namnaonensis]
MKKTAILIDAGFFIQRVNATRRKHFKGSELTAAHFMKIIWGLVQYHVNGKHGSHEKRVPLELYRIYFYDCPPLDIQTRYPLPSEKDHKTTPRKNFKLDPSYILRAKLHEELRKSRKTALRLGTLVDNKRWQLNDHVLTDLIKGIRKWEDLTNDDFHYDIKQKAVDIKLGMDITTLAYEKLVEVIVLVAGDSDFVPAAKHARTKGIDFILDPLRQEVSPSLSEHIDGVQSYSLISALSDALQIEPDPVPDWWSNKKEKKPKSPSKRQSGSKK